MSLYFYSSIHQVALFKQAIISNSSISGGIGAILMAMLKTTGPN